MPKPHFEKMKCTYSFDDSRIGEVDDSCMIILVEKIKRPKGMRQSHWVELAREFCKLLNRKKPNA